MSELDHEVSPSGSSTEESTSPQDWKETFSVRVFTAVALVFVIYSFVRIPIPAVNEPHYMAKAKYFWDACWCPDDFFLSSPNPHLVFYATTGWLTLIFSLEFATLILRLAVLVFVACGWTYAFSALTQSRWGPFWMASLFLLLQTIGSFSGEWIVGGVESKVFTYGFVFFSLGFLFRSRWTYAAASLGAAISFHPVVGIWALLCGVFATFVMFFFSRSREKLPVNVKDITVSFACLVAAALPGLIPALWLLAIPTDPEVSFQADFIAVYYRLKHHLDPMRFRQSAYIGYAALTVFWLICVCSLQSTRNQKWFNGFVLASLMVAFVGLIAGLRFSPPEDMPVLAIRMKLLKFYPFRFYDAMLPIVCCLVCVQLGQRLRWTGKWWVAAVPMAAMTTALLFPGPDQDPSRLSEKRKANWIRMTDWIENNTARDAEFITPKNAWAFKWFASRPEYVAYKDIPQDATGMVEWKQRLTNIRGWAKDAAKDDLVTRAETDQLYEMTGADYLIVQWLAPFEVESEYRNKSFRIFRISPVENPVD